MNLSNFNSNSGLSRIHLPRDDKASQPKGWIQGNVRIGPVLEVTTSFQHFKYGIEIRIKSVNQDDSHSWVRISYGTVKYVNDSIDDTENPADPQEEANSTNKHECGCRQRRRQKQNLNREYSLGQQQLYQYMKEDGLTLSHQNKICLVRSLEESHHSSSTQSARRRWSNSILQDKIPSTRPSFSNTELVR